MVFYPLVDLALTRDRSPALIRSWTVMHRIDEASPLFGLTPRACIDEEVQILASVVGTDDTSLQPVHARKRYPAGQLLWGARPADVLSELPSGELQLDVRKFDEVATTEPTETFPYPSAS